VASAKTIEKAYELAHSADPLSAFGGVVAMNDTCTGALATQLSSVFTEVLLAPSYTDDALAVLASKPNLRVLVLPPKKNDPWEMRFISGGVLLQEKDPQVLQATDLTIVTEVQPKQEDIDAMLFAWRVLKHIKSNGILIAKDQKTVGIGAGQVSRVDSVDIAVRKAGDNIKQAILASDAFFPFRDSIDLIAKTGIRAIIQPGGSVRDEEVISACNEHGIAMVFTGKRCFRH
jgi:phosphoribosylaminoimidazolecarboxamide formyltransferase/IMP cyclohydrolase